MARYGYLVCTVCKEEIFLGKWLRTNSDEGIGFWHGTLCKPGESDSLLLGRKVLRFVARHMDHELFAASDEGGRMDAINKSGGYADMDEKYDSLARH